MSDSKNRLNTPEIVAAIQKLDDEGSTRAKIEGWLLWEHDASVNEAKDIVQEVLGRSGRDSVSLEKVVSYIRENYGTLSKQDLIEGMCKVTGGKHSSMNHMYNYIRLAQEYARQEVEAAANEAD